MLYEVITHLLGKLPSALHQEIGGGHHPGNQPGEAVHKMIETVAQPGDLVPAGGIAPDGEIPRGGHLHGPAEEVDPPDHHPGNHDTQNQENHPYKKNVQENEGPADLIRQMSYNFV